ncbi:class I adenylate-forming enzyme family protein [Halobaculum roseum]|uniref:Class I adenylate-forming enzyme family protein n=1 Tax=Halobaculum roseum TaxID=2175149 RepID=A0ABD5MJL9_9EURY|nr:class I adenylate-forming enzyme family protein [Halobaculum roseum]QZY03528.1 acyl--CoA ligase [Halobaculum roseum]
MRDWLSHRVAATPDAEALVLAASGESLTYADLDARVEALAARFAGLGIEPGDHLAVVLGNRMEYVALVHAAMRLGVRLVPCSDRLTAAELAPKLATADATALVCGDDTEAVAVAAALGDPFVGSDADGEDPGEGDADEGTPGGSDADATATGWRSVDGFEPARVDERGGDEGEEGATAASPVPVVSLDDPDDDRVVGIDAAPDGEVPAVRWGRGDTLVMLFTSGSTGKPKLVPLSMGNVLASATASAFRLGVLPDDRYLATLSLHHTGGIMPLYRATLYGTSVVLRESFDAGGAVDDIRRYDVTGVSLVPTMLSRMLEARGTLPDSLRTVLLGGAPAPDSLIERCRDFSVPVHPTWGMTEAASQIATARPREAFDRVGTVGRPLLWTEVSVRDEDGAALPAGETGELVVSGPSIAAGYYGDAAATDDALTDDGALRTGDVGYRDEDGYVYVLNRLDDRIVSGGENVDPGEVAAAIRDHPGVDDVAVAGIPDEEWGERVAALVVPAGNPDPDLDAAAVDSFCRDRLAGFKIPRTVAFVEELPRSVSGTVERPAVRDRLERARDAEAEAEESDGPADPDDLGDADGASGVDEAAGADGKTASAEEDADGTADADGDDGSDGIAGADGDDGSDGIAGADEHGRGDDTEGTGTTEEPDDEE